jgi:hypothetical protein
MPMIENAQFSPVTTRIATGSVNERRGAQP